MIHSLKIIVFTCLLVVCFQSKAFCKVLQSEENTQRVVSDATFIGLARVSEATRTDDGIVSSITLRPMFAYKTNDNVDLPETIRITFDTRIISNWDYRPAYIGGYVEVVLYKEENGDFRLGGRPDMALGKYWKKLRKGVKYIEHH